MLNQFRKSFRMPLISGSCQAKQFQVLGGISVCYMAARTGFLTKYSECDVFYIKCKEQYAFCVCRVRRYFKEKALLLWLDAILVHTLLARISSSKNTCSLIFLDFFRYKVVESSRVRVCHQQGYKAVPLGLVFDLF